MRHRLGLATRTQISVCKSPFPSAGTAVSLFPIMKYVSRPKSSAIDIADILGQNIDIGKGNIDPLLVCGIYSDR